MFITKNFLIIALVLSAIALWQPEAFLWARTFIPALLGLIMFGMGLSLNTSEFAGLSKKKSIIIGGFLLQYTIMPLAALMIGKLMGLDKEILIGLIVVGSCPGGTASNVMVYLSNGNVPLSIVLTFLSTIAAPVLTPAIIYFLLGKMVDISFRELFFSVLYVVAFPLLAGIFVKVFFDDKIESFRKIFPAVSVVSISLIIAIIMAVNRTEILKCPVMVFVAVVLHNAIGLAAGYIIARVFGALEKDARTISIEVGMQNSGLGAALANQFFSPLSALPAALFSLWHNVSGIIVSWYWKKDRKP